MNFNYRSLEDLIFLTKKNLDKIPKDIDLVVGIPRSGLLLANLISLYINKPISDLNGFLNGQILSHGKRKLKENIEFNKILIVDDSLWSGDEINEAKTKINSLKSSNIEFIFLVGIINPKKISLVDIFFESVNGPRIFEWNILNSWIYSKSCTDLDGILCFDPTEEENDDGKKYENFILNAKPKFTPFLKVNTIVTARLEKYRSLTIKWLEDNNIEFDSLIMMNLPNKDARIKAGNHASFKAQIYKKSETQLFIESAEWQAKEIFRLSNKPVFCSENMKMYFPIEKKNKLFQKFFK